MPRGKYNRVGKKHSHKGAHVKHHRKGGSSSSSGRKPNTSSSRAPTRYVYSGLYTVKKVSSPSSSPTTSPAGYVPTIYDN